MSEVQPQLLCYRDKNQREVDVVLEAPDGQPVGIEVKAKASLQRSDLAGLRRLMDRAGERFLWVVLYDGVEKLPMGKGCGRCRWRRCEGGRGEWLLAGAASTSKTFGFDRTP